MLQTVSGLTSSVRSKPPQVFALDLNCAIYHCTRKVSKPYTTDTRIQWEASLIQEVLGYIKQMTKIVSPSNTVYIAVDGVAPMAKIRQQRARRFKSAVIALEEAKVKAEAAGKPFEPVDRWDSNAITPGTEFMRKLATALREFRITGVNVIVSPADEAGEGEQKIMSWIREQPAALTDIAVYGLDADLIVLSMMEHARSGRTVDLFREETEFNGAVKSNTLGEEQFLYLDIGHLAKVLHGEWSTKGATLSAFLYDFVGIMNLLGNDFVPHGMGLKIHEEGIEHALTEYKTIGARLVENGAYNPFALAQLLQNLGKQEDRWILRTIRKKLDARVGGGAGNTKDPEAKALAIMNDRPVEWAAERVFAEQRYTEGFEKPRWEFRENWKSLYYQYALWNSSPNEVIRAYCKTLTWTLKYYIGNQVDMTWYYPWLLPPFLSDIADTILADPSVLNYAPPAPISPLKPIEQLAMVLPISSFHLLPKELHALPQRFPYAWPTSWGLFSIGRRFLWECEPLIPLIQPTQIKNWIDECIDT